MNSEEQVVRERGDSDDEIAELRFQALLTKKENEAEVSPSRKPLPVEDNSVQRMMNQPLSNFRGQPVNYRGRGSGYYKQPYLHTFSQQMASKSVNSNNIVVLTSSEPEDNKQPYPPEWGPGRGGMMGKGARWPKGEGRGQMRGNAPPMAGSRQAPPLVLPQDKYANQSGNAQTPGEQTKLKLSARMRRLQGSDSDSEDSDTDSSDDSSSSSSSDSDSSSDSSSSDSDSESDNSQEVAKKVEKPSKKDKVDTAKHAPQASAKHEENSHNSHSNSSKKMKSPVKMATSKQSLPPESKKAPQSPVYRKETSRSPLPRRRSRSPSNGPYPVKVKSPPPRARRSPSFSSRTRRYSRSPPRRPRTSVRRYGSRSPPPRYRSSHSPGRPARIPKSPPPPLLKKLNSKSPPSARPRSPSRSPYFIKRYKSRSPYLQKRIRSPLRRNSRSPLPPRRLSRSPLAGRLRSRSPLGPKRYGSRSPRPLRRYGSMSPPPGRAYNSRSPYTIRRYGSRSPHPYPKRLSSASPKRFRSPSPRNIRSPPPYKDYGAKSLGTLGKGSPPRRRKASFSPPSKRYGSRSPLRSRISPRGRRSPVFRGRDRTPATNLSSPQRIKRIGSLSPQPSGGQSPFRKFKPRTPPVRRYGTPPLRRISPGINMRMEHLSDSGMLKSSPFIRTISPRGHNYTSRSPSPYHRGRYSPGIPISARNIPPDSQSPPYYEPRQDHYHGKPNRNISFEKEVAFSKRFPGDQNPPWLPHKSELISPMKPPPIHHYPPKFADVNFDTRPGYLLPAPHHQQMQEKGWTPGGPMGRGFNNFGNGRGGHPRIERLDLAHPPPLLGERGRGGRPTRGGRGQRGMGRGGVHARLGRGNAWTAQLQGQQGGYEHPPQLFSDPYIRDRPSRSGGLLTSPEHDMEYMGRKPPPFNNLKPIPQTHSRNSHSPGMQRIPRGPKTPPYSPRRDPSPIEYEKRARGNMKQRTPTLSPVSQSPHRFANEGALRKQSRERKEGLDSRSNSENIVSHRQVHYPNRSRSPVGKHEQRFNEPHSNRGDPRRDNSKEVDERRKPVRTDDNSFKHKDYKKESVSESKTSTEDAKTSMREKDRRDDGRQRSPFQPKAKGSSVYSNSSLGKNKEYEGDFKVNKERDVRSRQDTEEHKGRKDNTEDARGKREPEEHRGRRENEEFKRRRENEEHKVKKDSDELKGRKNEEERKGTRRDIEELRGRRDNMEDRNVRRDNEERFGGRKDREPDDRSAEKKKTENERDTKSNNNIKERKETENREKIVKRVDRKVDRNIEKSSAKVYDKPKETKHADERRENKELSEHTRSKDGKEKIDFHDEKKKKKKKHREEDRSKSSKKKKKEKKKKKDSKKQKKKLKDPESEQQIKKKKSLDDDRESVTSKQDDLRHMLSKSDNSIRDKGGPKRKENTVEEDRDGKKRRKEEPVISGKDDWKWRGRENEKRKEDRPPLPPQSRERERMYTGDKQGNEAGRGGKGIFVTVSSGVDRQVISSSNSGKDTAKREPSRLPVHMRLSGKGPTSDKPVVNKPAGPLKPSKGGRIGDTIGGGRRKGGPQSSLHRQGMKRTKVTNR